MRARDAYSTPSPWFGLKKAKLEATAPDPEDTATLVGVLDDVAQHLLAHLGAHDVTRLALTSSIWRNHVRTFRSKILERTQKMYGEVRRRRRRLRRT